MQWRFGSEIGIKPPESQEDMLRAIPELQAMYYQARSEELTSRIAEIGRELKNTDARVLSEQLSSSSLAVLKKALHDKYYSKVRRVFSSTAELYAFPEDVCAHYPVILSTTFSARTTLRDYTYDYVIMDEA